MNFASRTSNLRKRRLRTRTRSMMALSLRRAAEAGAEADAAATVNAGVEATRTVAEVVGLAVAGRTSESRASSRAIATMSTRLP